MYKRNEISRSKCSVVSSLPGDNGTRHKNAHHMPVLTGKKILCLLLLTLLSMMTVKAEAESPDVSLLGLDGQMHHLNEFIGIGKWAILNIWGPGCPPCVEEMPDLQNFSDANKEHAVVVGMALDFPSFGYAKKDEVAAFVDDYFIDFPVLLGDAKVVEKFGAGPLLGTPTTLVYEPGGKLVARQVGQVTRELIEDFIRKYAADNADVSQPVRQ